MKLGRPDDVTVGRPHTLESNRIGEYALNPGYGQEVRSLKENQELRVW